MRRLRRLLIGAACALAASACGSFQDPDIVVDIRVLAMESDKPEQIIALDPANPPPVATLLAQVQPAQMCALTADPYNTRRLAWSMTLCPVEDDERCDDGDPQSVIGSGFEDDPDITQPEPTMCATVLPDADFLAVVSTALANDQLNGLGGLYYAVVLRVGGEGGDPKLDLFASKELLLTPNIPATRTPNQNPYIDHLDEAVNDQGPVPIDLGRCIDQANPLVVHANDSVDLTPIEPLGVREVYQQETVDGKLATFTESLTYEWTATYGSFSSGSTGGPADAFGNLAALDTIWTAPDDKTLANATTDVALWVVQRDERLGAHWYETCIRVMP